MDILSHGLWGAMPFYRKSRRYYWLAFLFGILPDAVAFLPHFILVLMGVESDAQRFGEPPPLSSFSPITFTLYNISHSFVVFAAVVLIVCGMRKKWFPPFFAWGLHILMDIPTHSTKFFPTPFLWPISSYNVNGYSWGHAWFLLMNYAVLIALYVFIRLRARVKTVPERL